MMADTREGGGSPFHGARSLTRLGPLLKLFPYSISLLWPIAHHPIYNQILI